MTIRVTNVNSHWQSRLLLGLIVSWLAFSGVTARAQMKDSTKSEVERLIYS